MSRLHTEQLIEVNSRAGIPTFASEDEEAEFWATHALGPGLLDELPPSPPEPELLRSPRTRPVAIRFDEDVLRRLKALARRKHKGYQSLLKEFVVERLYEEEKREGIVGGER